MSYGGISFASNGAAAATYVGPGDQDTYVFWGGLRAYSAAKAAATAALIRIVDSSNANGTDIHCLASGDIDNTTLNAWIVSHGTASITKIYDQVGSFDVVNGTVANMPIITQNAIKTSFPVATFNGTSSRLVSASNLTQAQPLTLVAVASANGGGARQIISDGNDDNGVGMLFYTSVAIIPIPVFQIPGPYTNGTVYMMQGYLPNSAAANSAIITVNGTDYTGAVGATTAFGPSPINVGSGQSVERFLNGVLLECGILAGAVNSRTNTNSNSQTYWGI